MVTETQVNSTKWSGFSLSLMILIAGIILQCYGLARIFQVSPEVATQEGLATNSTLGPYMNCDDLARSRPGSQNQTQGSPGEVDRIYAEQCKGKQRPYIYLWSISAALAFFVVPAFAWAIHKETRGPILLSAMWGAVVLSLLFISLYAYLQVAQIENKLLYCDGLKPEDAAEIETQNLGVCIDHSRAASHWHLARRCLFAGIILNIIGISFLTWVLPWIFHLSKVRIVIPPEAMKGVDPRIRGASETVQAAPIGATYGGQPTYGQTTHQTYV